jgi:signal transduction histidine kinase
LYLVSSALLVAGFVSMISNILQRDRLYFIPPGNIVNGLLAEITILTIVFVYKYKREREEFAKKALMSVKLKEELSQSLLLVQEAERKRIAQDLHDDVGNTLTGLRLYVQNHFSRVLPRDENEQQFQELIISELTKVNYDLRDISHNLLPRDLELGGLISGIKTQLELAERNNANIKFDFIYDGNFDQLTSEIEINIYRVFTELLQNIVKHSEATKATFECLVFNNTLQVIAEDNGKGFDSHQSGNGIGISNIKSRVSYLRGIYRTDSSTLGTTTIVETPLT